MDVEAKVCETIEKYGICSKDEKIIVALSGGKDSMSVAHILHKLGYNIEGFYINLKFGAYSEECLNRIKEHCDNLGIKLHVYDLQEKMGKGMCIIRNQVRKGNMEKGKGYLNNCAICGVIKKWVLNSIARELKADKIAMGHNLDDEAQTFLLNIMKGNPQLSANSGPITRNAPNSKFVPRIKPLFFVPENEVREYSKKMKLPVNYEKCPCAIYSYRIQLREFLRDLPNSDKENIMKNFERILPLIQKQKTTEMNYCESCGEPSRKKVCKKCELLSIC